MVLRGLLGVCLLATTANAATLVVNSVEDAPDQAIDGVCLTAAGECTLRAAIEEANATAAADTIEFQIALSGIVNINLSTMLPVITNPVHIDARTQPGYTGTPLIAIGGSGISGDGRGLLVSSPSGPSELSGLVMRYFSNAAATFSTTTTVRSSVFVDNNIGIEALAAGSKIGEMGAGNAFYRNSFAGVFVGTNIGISISGNNIGPTENGVISVGGNGYGVLIRSGEAEIFNNVISGNGIGVALEFQGRGHIHDNLIGTDASGTALLGAKQSRGVQLRGSQDNLVEHNTIANCMWGVEVWGELRATVRGNYLGTTSAGTGSLGNDIGVYIHNNATMNTIGGPTLADRNVIVGSMTGIQVEDSVNNAILGNLIGRDITNAPQPNMRGASLSDGATLVSGNVIASNTTYGLAYSRFVRVTNNSIFANGGLGIDLESAGPTPNTPGDIAQDFPVIAAASTDGSSTFVRGTATGTPSTTLDLELFAQASCDPSGYGEGETRIGTVSVQTDAAGDATFFVAATAVAAGTVITATATGPSTSEFSACVTAVACPTITVAPMAPPNPQLGVAYTQALTASGGAGSYTFASTGMLPPGLSLAADGTLAGTPTTAGTFMFTVTATDPNGCHGQRMYTMTVCAPITVAPSTIDAGTTQSSYNVTLSASGGTPAYSYAITSGAAPTGLVLSTGGMLTGTPTAGGDFTFVVTATDANACTGTQSYSVHIDSCGGTLEPATLPLAVTGVAYDVTLSVAGGVAPFTYALASGTLPDGISLVGDHLAGTPTGSGDATFTITATDALGCATARTYTLMTTCAQIAITPPSLHDGMEGVPYATTLTATGGAAPYTFTTTTLPPGLELSSDGSLTGEPEQAGDHMFTVTAKDANGCIGIVEYTLAIDPAQASGCGCASNDTSGGWTLLVLVCAVLSAIRVPRERRCRARRRRRTTIRRRSASRSSGPLHRPARRHRTRAPRTSARNRRSRRRPRSAR